MAIHLHRAERTDRLAHALGDLLAQPPEDPFTPDLVAVPTPGIERFLTQTLGRRLGTSAGPGRTDGQIDQTRVGLHRLAGGLEAFRRARDADASPQPPPEPGLPGLVGIDR